MTASSPSTSYQHYKSSTSDKELLDFFSTMPSSFSPSTASQFSGSPSTFSNQLPEPVAGAKRRPLATLSALRRPPIDPIILAASLSSGPQVTRHHFHHSYSQTPHGPSHQMPASQRRAAEIEQRPLTPDSGNPESKDTDGRPRSHSINAGSYANCDMEDHELDNEETVQYIEPFPKVTNLDKSMYTGLLSPKNQSLKLEEKVKDPLLDQKNVKGDINGENGESNDFHSQDEGQAQEAHASHVASSNGIHESRDELSPSGHGRSASQAHQPRPFMGTPADPIQRVLSEQRVIASAPATPSFPPTPGYFNVNPLQTLAQGSSSAMTPPLSRLSSIVRPPPLSIRCYARTRVPTPHGEVFCHLYRNNRDNKEHLALVVDPAQNEPNVSVDQLMKPAGPRSLRSRTLDEVWSPEETEMERIVRGAYVGRLGPNCQVSSPGIRRGHEPSEHKQDADEIWEAPLVRIHSECYTGETIGSQRCDCGEQLDEALRLILHSGAGVEPPSGPSSVAKKPRLPRGVVVYLRQEGRGIGLLDKLMAYNLQDMGHDTVSANVLLGHLPDARDYAAAGAILEDLGVSECQLLTNNPEKMEALEAEGIRVTERVGMVPRAWMQDAAKHSKSGKDSRAARRQNKREVLAKRSSGGVLRDRRVSALASSEYSDDGMSRSILSQAGQEDEMTSYLVGRKHQGSDVGEAETDESASDDDGDSDDYQQHLLRSSGATLIGGAATRGVELERYLRTKVERMGHLLNLPAERPGREGAPSTPSSRDEVEPKAQLSKQPNGNGSQSDDSA